MKIINTASFYMSECQATFQWEYSFSEARSYQGRQKRWVGMNS